VLCWGQFFSYAVGFFYALFVGHCLIELVLRRITFISDKVFKKEDLERVDTTDPEGWRLKYQPKLIGFIERTLYMSALIYGRGEFIAVWLGLKVAGGWKRWQHEKYGRYLYSSSLIGNGLSVLYALVGFMIAKGLTWQLKDFSNYPFLAAVALIIATLGMLRWLKKFIYNRKQIKQHSKISYIVRKLMSKF
jgi:hypothetical protein